MIKLDKVNTIIQDLGIGDTKYSIHNDTPSEDYVIVIRDERYSLEERIVMAKHLNRKIKNKNETIQVIAF